MIELDWTRYRTRLAIETDVIRTVKVGRRVFIPAAVIDELVGRRAS